MNKFKSYYDQERNPWGTKPTHFVRETKDLLKDGTVLDLGGGDGKNSLYLAQHGLKVTNLDNNSRALTDFTNKAFGNNISVRTIHADISQYNIKENYDNIICIFTLHFLSRQRALEVINQMQLQTNFGGMNIIVAFTNRGGLAVRDTNSPTNRAMSIPRNDIHEAADRDAEFSENFFLRDKELLKLYWSFDICRYAKMMGGTKANIPQERVLLAARKS